MDGDGSCVRGQGDIRLRGSDLSIDLARATGVSLMETLTVRWVDATRRCGRNGSERTRPSRRRGVSGGSRRKPANKAGPGIATTKGCGLCGPVRISECCSIHEAGVWCSKPSRCPGLKKRVALACVHTTITIGRQRVVEEWCAHTSDTACMQRRRRRRCRHECPV